MKKILPLQKLIRLRKTNLFAGKLYSLICAPLNSKFLCIERKAKDLKGAKLTVARVSFIEP